MVDIENRSDLEHIVKTFYARIQKNEHIGHIFTQAITEDEWDAHMVKITNFWDSAVFGAMNFNGNPASKHVQLDKDNHYQITQDHFSIWLQNWNQTVDELFKGKVADNVKMRARKMATGLYMGIWHHKPDDKKPQID